MPRARVFHQLIFSSPAICGGLLLPSIGHAQIAQMHARPDAAGERPQPGYDPVGFRAGGWTLRPDLKLTTGYDSNVFGQQRGARSDGFALVNPSFRAVADGSRFGLDLRGNLLLTRYYRFAAQNTDEYSVAADGRLTLGRLMLTPSLLASRTAERRGANGVPLTFGQPSLYDRFEQELALRQTFAQFDLQLGVRHNDLAYSDVTLPNGVVRSQRFRDSDGWSGRARIGRAVSGPVSLFVLGQVGHSQSRFPLITALPGAPGRFLSTDRTNDSHRILAGVAIDSGMFGGEIGLGYANQRFDNPAYPDYGGVNYDATLSWYPTRLITATVSASKTLENSGVINVGAIVERTVRLDLAYELLRNLVIRADGTIRRDRYREVDTTTTERSAGLRAEAAFNRNVLINVYQRYACRESSATAIVRRYCVFVAGASLTARR